MLLAALATMTYRASWNDVVRQGNEALVGLPEVLERGIPAAATVSIGELVQWHSDPVLVDRIGTYARSRQYDEDRCGGKDQVWNAHALQHRLGDLGPAFFSEPPYLHLSGISYVMLAVGTDPAAFAHTGFLSHNKAFLHVSELREMEQYGLVLESAERQVAGLTDRELHRLSEGSALLLTEEHLFVGTHSNDGSARYRVFPRSRIDAFLSRRGLTISNDGSACLRRVDGICFESDPSAAEQNVIRAQAFGGGSIVMLLFAAVSGYAKRRRERLRNERSQLFALQTLSHELRTPATSLALSLEPVRSHFDELPDSVQPAFLRICDNVQRLQRMVEASTHYLRGGDGVYAPKPIPNFDDILLDLAEAHDARALLELNGLTVTVDAYWTCVCVRNLLVNAKNHGATPVQLSAAVRDAALQIEIRDGGVGLAVPLKSAVQPFVSGAGSNGLGFGLSIVDRVVRGMGGKLVYQPAPTRFTLLLPVEVQ